VHWRHRLLLESEGSEDGGSCLGTVRHGVDVGSALHHKVFLFVPEQYQLSLDVHSLPEAVNRLEVGVSVAVAYFGTFVHANLFYRSLLVLAIAVWTFTVFVVRQWKDVVFHVMEHRAGVALERILLLFSVVDEVFVTDIVTLLSVAHVRSGSALGMESAHVATRARVCVERAFFNLSALAAVLS
jgi:hypothetical protein